MTGHPFSNYRFSHKFTCLFLMCYINVLTQDIHLGIIYKACGSFNPSLHLSFACSIIFFTLLCSICNRILFFIEQSFIYASRFRQCKPNINGGFSSLDALESTFYRSIIHACNVSIHNVWVVLQDYFFSNKFNKVLIKTQIGMEIRPPNRTKSKRKRKKHFFTRLLLL